MKISDVKKADLKFCQPYTLPTDASFPEQFDSEKYTVFPGFCDVHVHFREPGFSYKETIASGSAAAAHGGYTSVCTMPNLSPVPDSTGNLQMQLDLIRKYAVIGVLPFGALTVGEKGKEIAALEDMADSVIGFSDDGKGIQSREMMRELMIRAKSLGKIISAHCEDESLAKGCINECEYARIHDLPSISPESEWRPIARDLELAAETGCAYHVCHISTKESVSLIREAKKSGVDVTCETAPHYLVFSDDDLIDDGSFRMNPPLRSPADRDALIEGICDGTVDMIATDHAPHSAEEKSKGLRSSSFGIVGLETAFPALYTYLVRENVISLEKLVALLCENPRRRFKIPPCGCSVWSLDEEFTVDPASFLSMGRSTPFAGKKLYGVNHFTAYNGHTVYIKP